MSSEKCRPFCLGLNVLSCFPSVYTTSVIHNKRLLPNKSKLNLNTLIQIYMYTYLFTKITQYSTLKNICDL